ncbi:MAG: Rrf2 family transcriptional regulator [Chloroflexi bacterium]|nr:Rrf2 family transcriptional regulator [Chloroflexota bacterium]
MRISAKADYALRAAAELAAHWGPEHGPLKGERLAEAQEIPRKFLENILIELKRAGLVRSVRGAVGGYQLVYPPDEISLADIIRAVEGPLANVRDVRPDELQYRGSATHLKEVFIAVRASLRAVLEQVTLADLVSGKLPTEVAKLAADPDAWIPHLASFGWVSPRIAGHTGGRSDP